MQSRRMKELEQKLNSSDRWTFYLAIFSILTIFQDMNNPEFLPGDTDWIVLAPTLIAMVVSAIRSEYFHEKIKERTELFGGRNYESHSDAE